jgi:thiol-disulfide isomerase/thioredoxin
MTQNTTPGKMDPVTLLADPDDISPHISSDKKTVVLFEMTGCPFCRMFMPAFQDFVEQRSKDCAFLRVKLDEYDNPLWQKYEIEAVPAVIVFAAGKVVSRADSAPMLGISKKKWTAFCAGLK